MHKKDLKLHLLGWSLFALLGTGVFAKDPASDPPIPKHFLVNPRHPFTEPSNLPRRAQLKWDDDFEKTIQEFEKEEQVCIGGGREAQLIKSQERWTKLENIGSVASDLYTKTGMKVIDPPPNEWKLENWLLPELKKWKQQWSDADAARKCKLVQLSYLYVIWQVSTLEPEIPITSFNEIRIKKLSPEVERDRRRASWAFRYLKSLPYREIPKGCRIYMDEAEARYKYIFTDRKPLGFAIGMCGRTMNAHYIDDDVGAKKRPSPKGWSGEESEEIETDK